MKKILDSLVWVLISFTIIVLLCTIVTKYHIVPYNKLFNDYKFLEVSLGITTLFLGFKMYDLSKGRKKIYYSLMCFFLTLCSIIFMIGNVN